jgi:hypothetical protein
MPVALILDHQLAWLERLHQPLANFIRDRHTAPPSICRQNP